MGTIQNTFVAAFLDLATDEGRAAHARFERLLGGDPYEQLLAPRLPEVLFSLPLSDTLVCVGQFPDNSKVYGSTHEACNHLRDALLHAIGDSPHVVVSFGDLGDTVDVSGDLSLLGDVTVTLVEGGTVDTPDSLAPSKAMVELVASAECAAGPVCVVNFASFAVVAGGSVEPAPSSRLLAQVAVSASGVSFPSVALDDSFA